MKKDPFCNVEITLKDKGEFLRGFLVLVKRNRNITEADKRMTMVIGKYFGFAEDFCLEAINELMENNCISEEPPIFSNEIIAEYFLKETSMIFEQFRPLELSEKKWLLKTAITNKTNYVIPGFYTVKT